MTGGTPMKMEPPIFGVLSNLIQHLKGAPRNTYVIPSGKLTACYGKLPFMVDLPIKNGDFP